MMQRTAILIAVYVVRFLQCSGNGTPPVQMSAEPFCVAVWEPELGKTEQILVSWLLPLQQSAVPCL